MDLIMAIDQGTSSSRVMVFKAGTSKLLSMYQVEISVQHPYEGWMEQNPLEIVSSVQTCMENVIADLVMKDISLSQIKGIGITNQRETTVVWNRMTGEPVYPAIVWSDARNASLVKSWINEHNRDYLRSKCGLPLATYFSATKLAWLYENVAEVKKLSDEKQLLFGTVDTWLLWNLTGGLKGGKHLTDVTNASRTMLMNLQTLAWDQQLLDFFGVSSHILPEIQPSSGDFGLISKGDLVGVPILGMIGDQQAALLGHGCISKGEAKNTYGTGCFLLYNTGSDVVESKHGLLTTVAYQQAGQPPSYALEGSVAVAGSAVRWLRDNLGMISKTAQVSTLAAEVTDTDGVYFVPAFSGLFAPHWRSDARGTMCGLSGHSDKRHICRAVLEAVCFQVKDIFEAMKEDSKSELTSLLVDGGMTASEVLLEIQANILGVEVLKPNFVEVSALGAAIAAGVSLGLWTLGEKIADITTYRPQIDQEERHAKMQRWKMAVERSLNWQQ